MISLSVLQMVLSSASDASKWIKKLNVTKVSSRILCNIFIQSFISHHLLTPLPMECWVEVGARLKTFKKKKPTTKYIMISSCVSTETSPEHPQRSSEMHSKKTVLIKTIETRDGEVKPQTICLLWKCMKYQTSTD